ncbi:MAG: VCBS repeat-containing protein, partial [Planctomycetales bacterium]|nr:VCBS repeat-containing protein [Planctomycetales bacterium]
LSPEQIELVDVNGDGLLDVVVPQGGTAPLFGAITVLLNNGDGTLASRRDFGMVGGAAKMDLADLDGDDLLDVVYVSSGPGLVGAPEAGNFSVSLGDGQGNFGAADVTPLDQRAVGVRLGDFNGDDLVDAIVLFDRNPSQNLKPKLVMFAGNGDGTFDAPQTIVSFDELLINGFAFEVADANSDGNLDIAIAATLEGASMNQNKFVLLPGNGDGTFATPIHHPAPSGSRSIAVVDVDDDGDLDFVLAYDASGRQITFANDEGVFSPRYDQSVAANTHRIATGDLNNDGVADVVGIYGAFGNSSEIAVRLNAGDGFFGSPAQTDDLSTNGVRRPIIADFDGDDLPDVLAVTTTNSNPINLTLLRGDGQGGYLGQIDSPYPQFIEPLFPIDGAGDGTIDLIGVENSRLVYLANDGAGTFTESQVFELNSNPQGGFTVVDIVDVYASDFDGDGLDDVVMAVRAFLGNNSQRDYVAVFRNTGGALERLDDVPLNGRPFAIAVADFDEDDRPDILVGVFQEDDFNFASTLQIHRGLGDGLFAAGVEAARPLFGGDITLWDGNDDGHIDVAVSQFTTIETYTGMGDGRLTRLEQIDASGIGDFRSVDAVDLDRDGAVDLLVSGRSGRVVAMMNNGRGVLAEQVSYLATGNESQGIAVGDLNGDQFVDYVAARGRQLFTRLNHLGERGVGRKPSRFTHDETFNQVTSFVDELDRTTLYTIDPNTGNRLEERIVIGEVGGDDDLVTTYSYRSDDGLVETITDPLGRVTRFSYDEFCRLIGVVFAEGTPEQTTASYDYDDAGNLIAVTDELGRVTRYEYDARGRVLRVVPPDPDGAGP